MRTIAETLRIEIPIETVDKTEPELSNLIRKLGNLGTTAERTGTSSQRAGERVSQFDRQAQKTEKGLAKWAKEKYEILLEAKDKIAPVLSKIGSGLRSFAGKTWNVTMRAVDLITSPVRGIINLLKNPIFQAGSVLGVSIGLKDTIDTYKGFEAAMSQVKAISGATDSEMTKLTNKAKEMGATTKFTAAESAEAFNYMAMAGWKTEDMMGGIEGILSLAAASGESLGTTSDIVTDALTAFGMKASEAGHFADVMAVAASNSNTNVSLMGETFKYAGAMAGTLKYSIEDVALATGLMANAGIKGNMSGTALNSIFTRLSTNTHGATDALKKLGIAYFNSDGSARAFGDIMKELRDATADFTDEQKANLANTVAGTYAQKGFLAILNATTEDYEKLSKAVNNADGAAAKMAEIMMDNLQGAITLLQSAADGVKISFGGRMAPYIRSFAEWLTEQMPMIESALDELMDWVDTKVDQMQRKFDKLTKTKKWKDANFFGKVKIAWDEFIAEPFLEWWNGTGKEKFAQNIGNGIGTGLRTGIMTLLGMNISEISDEGVSFGAAFAKGFSEGFDFDTVSGKLWQGFKGMFSSAGKLLPGGESAGLSSVLSAIVLSKVAKLFIGMAKGGVSIGKGLFGVNPETGTSLVGSFLGSAAKGTGLRGLGATMGLTGLKLGSHATTGAGLITAGAAGTLGGIAAGATLISAGVDTYKAIKSSDKEEQKAYGTSAGLKAGGVGVGATIGTLILPGVGTLIGAGVGGIAGWLAGNKIKEKYQEEYQENVEEMQKEAQKAQKVFEATGFAIEDVTFKNKTLVQAMNDSEVSASQFALMFQEECANVAKKAFGDISLSLAEVKKVASEITFGNMAEGLNMFAQVTSDTEAALNSLELSVSDLKKENWKVGLNMELLETDKDSYKGAIENFLNASQTFIDDNHYQATVALKLLTGEEADTSSLDSYYEGVKNRVNDLSAELTDTMNAALEDGIIMPDEAKALEELQSQIAEITGKIAKAKTDAEFQALQIKHKGAALDADSFSAVQVEAQEQKSAGEKQYYNALVETITNLNLQYTYGTITDAEYQDKYEQAMAGYQANIEELDVNVRTFNLDSIATAFEEQLSDFMPEMEGSLSEKLSEVLNNTIIEHPNITAWTDTDIIKWIGLDKLNIDSADQATIALDLKQTALAVPEETKRQLIDNYLKQVPTAEEIRDAVDWSSLTNNDVSNMLQQVGVVIPDNGIKQVDMPLEEWARQFGKDYDELINDYTEQMSNSLIDNKNVENLSAFTKQYMPNFSASDDARNIRDIMAQYGPVSNERYDELIKEWEDTGVDFGTALSHGASATLLDSLPLLRTDMQTALEAAMADPFFINPSINMTPAYNITTPTLPTVSQETDGHAAGGYVSGGPQLSWLAEEGYGEFIIPTNPNRRSRALELYKQAGDALGVSAHASGGYVGGSISHNTASNYNLFNDANKNAPIAYNETTQDNYNAETTQIYEPVSAERESSLNSPPIQVNVSLAPEFVIHGGDGQSEENIMQIIRRHMKELADELNGEIAGTLEEVFSNMPLKEA